MHQQHHGSPRPDNSSGAASQRHAPQHAQRPAATPTEPASEAKQQSDGTARSERDGIDFLLAEYASAKDLIAYYGNRADKRVDALLVSLTAVVAGLVLLSQTRVGITVFLMAAMLLSLAICVLALYAVLYVFQADLTIVDRGFAMQRIREYFAARHPDLRDTILTPLLRADGTLVGAYGNWRLPMLVGAFSGGAFVAALALYITNYQPPNGDLLAFALGLGALAAIVFQGVQEVFFRRKYAMLERTLKIKPLQSQDSPQNTTPPAS